MNTEDNRLMALVLGLPIAGLIYCGFGVALMATSQGVRSHPIVSGALFLLVPLTIGASIWIRASAKAYKKS